jgi:hypothetical protein
MLIECDTPLSEGNRLSCMFYLPNATNIEVSGKIIKSVDQAPGHEDHQYGLMFTNISAEPNGCLPTISNSFRAHLIPAVRKQVMQSPVPDIFGINSETEL